MKSFNQFISEAFDKPYRYDFEKEPDGSYYGYFRVADGSLITVMCEYYKPSKEWNIEFTRNGSQDLTGEGDAMRIFATVIKIIERFLKEEKPDRVRFSALKDGEDDSEKQSREKLYSRMVKRFAGKMGYNAKERSLRIGTEWELTRKK